MNLIRNILMTLAAALALFITVAVYGQDLDRTLSSDPGGSEIKATRSITLRPNFSIAQGRSVRIFIDQNPANVAMPSAGSVNRNYVMRTTYLKPYTSVPSAPKASDRMQDLEYYDGLGRAEQSLEVKGSPDFSDIVTLQGYDGFGRPERSYLPYAAGSGGAYRGSGVSEQAGFYNIPSAGVVRIPAVSGVTPSFSRTVYEASPLDRVREQGFPGRDWQPSVANLPGGGHSVRTEHASNNNDLLTTLATTRKVMLYRVTYAANGLPQLALTTNQSYATGQLYVTISRSEDWNPSATGFAARLHTVEEYTDKQGRVVCRRTFNRNGSVDEMLSTYYVYDDLGQLTFVLTPGAQADRGSLPTGSALTNWLNEFAYQYYYDERGRVAEKKIPGRGWENYIYNPLDQLVFHQDARQSTEDYDGFTPGKYNTFYKYDGLGRVILRGVERNRSMSRQAIQDYINGFAHHWEERSKASGHFHGYTNRSNPQGAAPNDRDVLEANYYDDYDIGGAPAVPGGVPAGRSQQTQGLLTASKVKVVGTSAYLWTFYFYDSRGLLLQTNAQHYAGATTTGNYDITEYQHSFTGQPTAIYRHHYRGGNKQIQINKEYVYDHRDRLVDTWMRVNQEAPIHVSRLGYNAIGQLRSRSLHGTTGWDGDNQQQIDYAYNERGWLLSSTSTLFSQELSYQTGSQKYYGGNIAGQTFTRRLATGGASSSGSWSYRYDALGRLTEGMLSGGRGREGVAYDRMGNITTLNRRTPDGLTADSLLYNYTGGRLMSVNDRSTNTVGSYMPAGTTSYQYDVNGNLRSRVNSSSPARNLTKVSYGILNVPQEITTSGSTLRYVYDGNEQKLRSVNGIEGQTRDYVNGIEYQGGSIELVHMDEGCIVRSSDGTHRYEYFLKDHLGNVRSGFRAGSQTVAAFGGDFYPFGLQYQSGVVAGSPKNNYLYNGKELQDRLAMYDYGARFYDPVIGRWGAVDPLAEAYSNYSPYAYVGNDPILFHDPNGMYRVDANGRITIDDPNEISTFFNYLSNNNGASVSDMSNHIISAGNGFRWELDAVSVSGRGSFESGGWVGDAQRQVSSAVNMMGSISSITTSHFGFEGTKSSLDIGGDLYGAFQTALFSGNRWLGKNGKYYNTSWGGNQYTGSRSGAIKASNMFKWAGRGTVLASVLIGGLETYRGYQMDGGHFGYNAQSAAFQNLGGVGGAMAGAALGAKIGAGFGAMFFGAGFVPGAIVGGVIGGYYFGNLGSDFGENAVNHLHKR